MKSIINKPMCALKKTLDVILIIVFVLLGIGALFALIALDSLYIKGGMILAVGIMILLHVFRQSADDASLLD